MESGNGTVTGYRVEAKYEGNGGALVLGDQTFTREWKQVHFEQGAHGVLAAPGFLQPWLLVTGCYGYQAAQALRWWLHANAEATPGGGICLYSRIVKYTVKYSIETKRETEHCEIGGDDRTNCIPDWGSKKSV